ncbi:MAG TPA: hypothetical protein VE135_09520 [Pyrinomonadaceae bacterium]|nr:hypothetical protein [Pyrinomonadaceae bacterium]
MEKRKWRARNKSDLIIEVWEQLDCESVGAHELETIQQEVRDRFGDGAVDSPAAIARLLAEEGAVLRHPEVLDFDTEWRQKLYTGFPAELDFSSLSAAAASMASLETWRKESEEQRCVTRSQLLHEFLADAAAELLFKSSSQTSTRRQQTESKEIRQWLSVWKQTQDLFPDWLELRVGSSEFRALFPDFERSS